MAMMEAKHGELSMMQWMATEGGRKCPMCGRYAKPTELGSIGGRAIIGGNPTWVSAYGHLPGFGCNVVTVAAAEPDPEGMD